MESELCAFADFAFHSYVTPMGTYDPACDGQTQPRAARSSIAGFLTTVEAFEDIWDIFGADTLACIAHRRFHARACPPHPNADPPFRLCMPHCVADQVIEHAANCLCIHQDGIHIRLDLTFQCDALLLCKLGKAFERI